MTAYNGWTNYQTWNVNLWIDNEQSSQEYWQERAQDIIANGDFAGSTASLADELKTYHQDNMPEGLGMYADLLQGALSEVNWHEIAKSIIADLSDKE